MTKHNQRGGKLEEVDLGTLEAVGGGACYDYDYSSYSYTPTRYASYRSSDYYAGDCYPGSSSYGSNYYRSSYYREPTYYSTYNCGGYPYDSWSS